MKNEIKLIEEYLNDNGYKVLEAEDKCITIRYELKTMYIICNDENENFVCIMMNGIDSIEPDSEDLCDERCMKINANQRVIKLYPQEGEIIATYEFFSITEEDLYYQIKNGIECLATVPKIYRSI